MNTHNMQASNIDETVLSVFAQALASGEPIDQSADFFEFGGTSMLAAQVVTVLRRELGLKVTVRDLFRARTAGALADAIKQRIDSSPVRIYAKGGMAS